MKHHSRERLRQREFGFTNWGGKRRGAGRKPKGLRALMSHAKRPKLHARYPVLLTLKLCEGLRTLRSDDAHAAIKQALAASSQRCELHVIEYSVQWNHLHLIAEATDERALAHGMISVTVRIARALNRLWKRAGRVFADRYHARILTTPRAVRIALIYCINNARKHGSWLAKMPDVFSSGPWFDGWKSAGRTSAVSRPRWLARARTWLLAIGWKRHGLLDPCEAPAPG
jgi:REP element-mobilizing transposase RayT